MLRQSAALAAIAATLSACTTPNGAPGSFNAFSFGPTTPGTPSAKDVLQATTDLSAFPTKETEDKIAALNAPDPNAPAYVEINYDKTDKLCNDYFDALIRGQNETQFSNDIVTEAASAATAILGLAGSKPNAIGITAAGTGFISSVIMSYNSRALMTPYPSETKSLIGAALAQYRASAPSSSAHTKLEAVYLVQHYAEICTYSGITRLSKLALSTSTVTTVSPKAPANLNEIALTVGGFLSTTNLTPENAEDLYYYLVTKPDLWTSNPAAAKDLIGTLPPNTQSTFEDAQGNPIDWSANAGVSALTKVLKLLYGEQSAFKTATDAEGVRLAAKITQNNPVKAAAALPPPLSPPPPPAPVVPPAAAPQIVINGGSPK